MKKMDDYSGDFMPRLELADFSQEALVRLSNLYSRLYSAVDGFWYLAMKEKYGNDEAVKADIRVWDRLTQYEMKHITKEFNIQGNDIKALLKALQLTPWFWHAEIATDFESEDSATYTVTRCKVLDYMEKEGEGREHQICRIVEPRILQSYASYFHRDIRAECLKVPPRQQGEEICCRWRFHIQK